MTKKIVKIVNILTMYIIFMTIFFLEIVIGVVFEGNINYSIIDLVENVVFACIMAVIFHSICKMNYYNCVENSKSVNEVIINNSKIKKIEFNNLTLCYNHLFSLLGYGKAIFISEDGKISVICSKLYLKKQFPQLSIK